MHGRQDSDAAAAFLSGGAGRGRDGGPRPGPWFEAAYEGECSRCFEVIEPGDLIRADGEGEYERQECCGDD